MELCSEWSATSSYPARASITHDDLFVLLNSLFVLILVCGRLEDSDSVVVHVGKDLNISSVRALEDRRQGKKAYPLLEQGDLLVGKGVGLGNDRNEVDLLMQSSHKLDIDWFEPIT